MKLNPFRQRHNKFMDSWTPQQYAAARILTGDQLAEAILARRPRVITQARLDACVVEREVIGWHRKGRTAVLTAPGSWFPVWCKGCSAVMWTDRRQACSCGERVQLYLCTPSMWLSYALGKIG